MTESMQCDVILCLQNAPKPIAAGPGPQWGAHSAPQPPAEFREGRFAAGKEKGQG